MLSDPEMGCPNDAAIPRHLGAWRRIGACEDTQNSRRQAIKILINNNKIGLGPSSLTRIDHEGETGERVIILIKDAPYAHT